MKEDIRKELMDMESSLAESRVDMPYSVPDGYFAAFSESLEGLLAGEGELNPEVFATRDMPYELPQKYFDTLPAAILAKVTNDKPKWLTLSLGQLRWAAAAVLLMAIGLATFSRFQGSGASEKKDGLLANVGEGDIRAYLVATYHPPLTPVPGSVYLDNVDLDAKDIIAYLDETGWNLD
jgi:hypothetical protein